MLDFDIEQLRTIGLNQSIIPTVFSIDNAAPERLVRIIELQRDRLTVHDGATELEAQATPRLLHSLDEAGESLAVGDWVGATPRAPAGWWITRRLPPATEIARRANDGRRQVLASNVDAALLVMGLDLDYNARRMERYIALVQASGVAPVVVLTKADIGTDVAARTAELQERLPASVPVLAVDARAGTARDLLAPWLAPGQTLVLLGASGTGKSTLTNTLADAVQTTGGVRRSDGRGQHTTTARSLHRCAEGACIIDTPGLRTWRPDAGEDALAATFEDIAALGQQCRFRDCRHEAEPGCAVRDAVPADRLQNYHKLLRDVQRSQQTPLERIAARAKWKRLGKAGTERARQKRA